MNEDIFNGLGNIYDKYRPSYPHMLIDFLRDELGMNKKSIIADIGSGTGILTQMLLKNSQTVYAIEPNNDMRKIAELKLSRDNNYISINATAEHTTLRHCSVDYITVAQAFHWFDRENFKKECQRILKPNGKVILIWNRRDEDSDYVQLIDSINRTFCPDFSGYSKGMRGGTEKLNYNDFFQGNYEIQIFKNPIIFNKERFLGLHQSASYCLKVQNSKYNEYIQCLSRFFDSNSSDGKLTLDNNTYCYIGCV